MLYNIYKHINSYDFVRSAILTLLIVISLFFGIENNQYMYAISFSVGVLFAFFSNIEGSNKHRIVGMLISLFWSLLSLCICSLSFEFNTILHYFIVCFFTLSSSLLAIYGSRGTLVSFSGLFAVMISFVLHDIAINDIISYATIGGLCYIFLSLIIQGLFQNKHSENLLIDCIELTSKFIEITEKLRWNILNNEATLQNKLLQIQNSINENHELLREKLIYKNTKTNPSNISRKQYLMFSELVNIYESAIAKNFDVTMLESELNDDFEYFKSLFHEVNQSIIHQLRNLAICIQKNNTYHLDKKISFHLEQIEIAIADYIIKIGFIKAREGTLMLRNILSLEQNQLQKLHALERTYNTIKDTELIGLNKASLFLTPQDYSLKILFDNLNTKSSIFRHSLRITFAVLIGILIGHYIHFGQTNWIVMTTIMILRPNYGLTKTRALKRVIGTVLGGIIAFTITQISPNHVIYGIISSSCLLFGFSYIQKNYQLATTLITISILLLFAITNHAPLEIISLRIAYTLIGVLVSILSMYLLWPVWEQNNINEALKAALRGNSNYLVAFKRIYASKEEIDTNYKLIRKEAFLSNGNLNAALQRMSEEPISKRKNINNFYACVLLNQTFLSAVAAFSSYTQANKTTTMSDDFKAVISYVIQNLRIAEAKINHKQITVNNFNHLAALSKLKNHYLELNKIRNAEIAEGKLQMSVQMRQKLLEGKIVVNQLEWLSNLSENIVENVEMLLQD